MTGRYLNARRRNFAVFKVWSRNAELTPFITSGFCGTRFKYRCNKLLLLSRFSTTGICDKHLSLVGTYHVVGMVHLYKYWPLVRFPPTVCMCDTYQVITSMDGTLLLLRSHNSFKRLDVCCVGHKVGRTCQINWSWKQYDSYSLGAFVKRSD